MRFWMLIAALAGVPTVAFVAMLAGSFAAVH